MASRKLKAVAIEHDSQIAADVVSVRFSRNLNALEGSGVKTLLRDFLAENL
jgi:hypothetical protein